MFTQHNQNKGATLVEFAIILPVFSALLFAALDFSIGFLKLSQIQMSIHDAARSGAVTDSEFMNECAYNALNKLNNRFEAFSLNWNNLSYAEAKLLKTTAKKDDGTPGPVDIYSLRIQVKTNYDFCISCSLFGIPGAFKGVTRTMILPITDQKRCRKMGNAAHWGTNAYPKAEIFQFIAKRKNGSVVVDLKHESGTTIANWNL